MKWTSIDKEYLINHYICDGPNLCSLHLNRNINSIKKMACRLTLSKKRRPFTNDEIEFIKENYAEKGPIALSKELKLNKTSICGVARRLKLKMTSEARGKISTKTNTGRKYSQETCDKIGNANRKYNEPNKCIECGHIIVREAKKCKPCELKSRMGEKHNWWNGGVTPLYDLVFKRLYPIWKFPIMVRDKFECQDCHNVNINLEVHHLRLFTIIRDKILNENPHLSIKNDKYELAELIISEHKLEDGITLCRPCHENRHWNKQGELLEPPNASSMDNQQPSQSNVINIVDWKVQRLMGEESQTNNPDTSALHI